MIGGLPEAARAAHRRRARRRAVRRRRRPRAPRGARPPRPDRARRRRRARGRSPATATPRSGTSPASRSCPRCSTAAASTKPRPRSPTPTEGQDIVADYRRIGLTLRRHPLALLRDELASGGFRPPPDVARTPHGRLVRTAGIVIGRQRPDTASGVVFVTLEDETGATNVIVWRDLARAPAPRAAGLAAAGRLRQGRARRRRRAPDRRTARRSHAAARLAADRGRATSTEIGARRRSRPPSVR